MARNFGPAIEQQIARAFWALVYTHGDDEINTDELMGLCYRTIADENGLSVAQVKYMVEMTRGRDDAS